MNKKIKKLDINLFPESASESEYNKQKTEFVANYEEYVKGYYTGGFLSSIWVDGYSKNNPVLGLAKWDEMYPDGYEEWAGERTRLTSYGQQNVINKINEIIDIWNTKNAKK